MGLYIERGYTLAESINAGLGELESWYGGKVLDTFDNDTLGVMHRYQCAEADQLRMVNGRVANIQNTLYCGPVPAQPDVDPIYSWISHTSAECGKVHTAYLNFTKDIDAQYSALKAQVAAATTVVEVEAALHIINSYAW